MSATVTITASDLQSILEDLNSSQLVDSVSYSKYNGVEIEWEVRCEPFEWELDEAVSIDEHERLEEQFKELQYDFDQLSEVQTQVGQDYNVLKSSFELLEIERDRLKQDYDELYQSRDEEYDELKRKYDALLVQCNEFETEIDQLNNRSFFKRIFG